VKSEVGLLKTATIGHPHILCTFAKFSTSETIVLKIDCIENNHK